MTTTNLHAEKAIDKLRGMIASIDFAMLCTQLGEKPFHSVPMSTKTVDSEGNIWFLSGKNSTHNSNIESDGDVELLYADPSSMQFLSVFGIASIHSEKSILRQLYDVSDDAWFDGVDDPNLTAIKVIPSASHYWDTKGNKLVALFKMGVASVTGERPDASEEGDLSL
jgi:general stress protein 26